VVNFCDSVANNFFFFGSLCWYCQNMFLAGYRDIRTLWLKFTVVQECKNNPFFHVVLALLCKAVYIGTFRSILSTTAKNETSKLVIFSCYFLKCTYLFIIYFNRDGVADTETTLRARGSGFRLTTAERNSPILPNAQTGTGSYPDSYSKGTAVLYQG
jgi:hypothetical protein